MFSHCILITIIRHCFFSLTPLIFSAAIRVAQRRALFRLFARYAIYATLFHVYDVISMTCLRFDAALRFSA